MKREDVHAYTMEQLKKRQEIIKKETWTDIDRLEFLLYSITPYSRFWRYGMIKALRHAIKLMKKEEKEKK